MTSDLTPQLVNSLELKKAVRRAEFDIKHILTRLKSETGFDVREIDIVDGSMVLEDVRIKSFEVLLTLEV